MNTTRPLSSQEHAAFAAARLIAFELVPYFAHALLATIPLAAPGLGTFAVDRNWRLYLDPDTLNEWGPQHSAAVLAHEVSHLVRQHADRAADIGSTIDHTVWNIATDAAINDDLIAAGIDLPGNPVTPSNQNLPSNGIEEDYYNLLGPAEPSTAPQHSTDDTGCGSGAGDAPGPWEQTGATLTPGLPTATQRIVRRIVAEAVRQQKGQGNAPAGITRWAEDTLTTPPLPWQTILASTVRRIAALTTGAITYTYTRPSRRRVPGIVLPALRAPKVTAAVVIDTSGSMSQADLNAALHETTAVVRSIGGRVALITCDAAANTAYVTDPRTIRLTGGGGTDMRVGIKAALATRPDPDAVIVLTDGYTPWPEQPTRANLIAALIGEDPPTDSVPSWATSLTIPST